MNTMFLIFLNSIRLERHVKKDHLPKRRIEPNLSFDFNHAYLPHSTFL